MTVRVFALIMVLIHVAACAVSPAMIPQTREQMKAGVISNQERPGYTVETVSSTSSMDQVVSMLQKKSRECIDMVKEYQRTNHMGVIFSETLEYTGQIERLSSAKAEYTIRSLYSVGAHKYMPDGGYYLLAVDVERGQESTQATLYGDSEKTFAAIYQAVKGWAQGKDLPCPRLPG